MELNIDKINKALRDIDFNDPEDFFYDGRCYSQWYRNFIVTLNDLSSSKTDKHDTVLEFYKNTSSSEEEFKEWFPGAKYEKWVSPWSYGFKSVSEKKIKKIAFYLQDSIPLEFNNMCYLLTLLYHGYKEEFWNFETFASIIYMRDEDLFLEIQMHLAMKKRNLAA